MTEEESKKYPRTSWTASSQPDNHGQLHLSSRRGPNGPAIVYHLAECDGRLWTEERDWHFREVRPDAIYITRDDLRWSMARAAEKLTDRTDTIGTE